MHDEAADGRRTPTGRRSSRSTTLLERIAPNPMVTLNHAVAVAMVARARGRARDCWRRWTTTIGMAGHHRLARRAGPPPGDGRRRPGGAGRVPRRPPGARPASPSSATSRRGPPACGRTRTIGHSRVNSLAVPHGVEHPDLRPPADGCPPRTTGRSTARSRGGAHHDEHAPRARQRDPWPHPGVWRGHSGSLHRSLTLSRPSPPATEMTAAGRLSRPRPRGARPPTVRVDRRARTEGPDMLHNDLTARLAVDDRQRDLRLRSRPRPKPPAQQRRWNRTGRR